MLVAFVGLVICTNVANVVWATWADDNPAGLIALSSRQRYLVLAVAGGISPLAFAIIGAARIAIAFVVCHLIGRAYREQALTWFTRYLGFTDEALDTYNRGFSAAEIGLIPFFAGSNIVAVLTGIHRTPPVRLAVLLAVGIAGRLVLMWYLAKTFEDQLLDALRFTGRYQWWVLGLSLAIVLAVNLRNFRRGQRP
jgi:pheromone shutdown protein TraB